MTEAVLYSTLLIAAVLLARIIFRNKASYRFIYALWVVVFIRLAVPIPLFEITLTQSIQASGSAEVSIEEYMNDWSYDGERFYNIAEPSGEQEKPSESIALEVESVMILRVVYLCGFVITLAGFVVSRSIIKERLKRGREFYKKIGRTEIYFTESDIAPCVFGVIPKVYIPRSMKNSERLETVLLHEFTHIKQWDMWRTELRKIITAVYWWNPAVWLYLCFAARDCELACDEAVVSKMDSAERLAYAELLLEGSATAAFAAGFGGKPLKKRIKAVISKRNSKKVTAAVALIMSVVCVLCFVSCKVEQVPSETTSLITIDSTGETRNTPVRIGENSTFRIRLSEYYKFDSAFEKADAVACVEIKSWLCEDEATFFSAEIIDCYKGDIKDSIILAQIGNSKSTLHSFPLFDVGNKYFLFLYGFDGYENTYGILGLYHTVMYVSNDNSGELYVVDVTNFVDGDFGTDVLPYYSPKGLEAKKNLYLQDPLVHRYPEQLAQVKVYKLDDIKEYLLKNR